MHFLIPLEKVEHRGIWGGDREGGVLSHPTFPAHLSTQKQHRFPRYRSLFLIPCRKNGMGDKTLSEMTSASVQAHLGQQGPSLFRVYRGRGAEK